MAKNYRPAAFPRRPQRSTTLSELRYNLELAYYRWELDTGSYVMTPGEKLVLNGTVLFSLLLLVVSIYWYLPSAICFSSHRVGYYLLGSGARNTLDIDKMVVDPTRGAAASIAQLDSTMNSSTILQPIF